MYLADTLSHAYLSDETDRKQINNHYEHETINMAQRIPIADLHLWNIQYETAKDETIQACRRSC